MGGLEAADPTTGNCAINCHCVRAPEHYLLTTFPQLLPQHTFQKVSPTTGKGSKRHNCNMSQDQNRKKKTKKQAYTPGNGAEQSFLLRA